MTVLGLLELPEEDVPPEEIWHSEDRMKEWFDAIKQRREDKARGFDPVPDADEEEDMTENAAVADLLGRK